MHQGEKYDLIDLDRAPEGDFLTLESINREKGVTRAIYTISPRTAKSIFKIGRGHESDLRITDISVSRLHAILRCTKEGFILEDNSSKFGTLILENGPVSLSPEVRQVLQVGRTVFQVLATPARAATAPTGGAVARGASTSNSENPKAKKRAPAAHIVHSEGGKTTPNNGDCNQIEDIPDEDENLM